MTETGAGAWITANEEPRHVGERCFGKAPRGCHRIADDAGIDVAPGAAGELLVRREGADPRRGFFSGYYKDDARDREAWAGGWFHTGDLVRVGADGAFFFVDRSKNVVRRSGENIAAVEVESALGHIPTWPRRSARSAMRCAARRYSRSSCCGRALRRPSRPRPLQAHCRRRSPTTRRPAMSRSARSCRRPPRRSSRAGKSRRSPPPPWMSARAFDLRHLKSARARPARTRQCPDARDVVLIAPVTVPYVRYSPAAPIGSSPGPVAALEASGLDKSDIDGLSVGSFTLAPGHGDRRHAASRDHRAVARSRAARRRLRHRGAAPRAARRRGGDAEVVACIGADTNHVDSFRQSLGSFSVFARDAVFPYGCAAARTRASPF